MEDSIWATIVDIVLFSLFCSIFSNFEALKNMHLYIFASTIIARIISATMSYNFNHRFVFKKKHRKKDTLYRFLIVSTSQMLISAFIVANLHRMIGGEEVLSKIPTDFFLFFVFYYFQRKFVFKR